MATLRDILNAKGLRTVFEVSCDSTVMEAVHRMNEHSIGAMIVMEDGHMVGVFTERDVLRRVVGAHRDPESVTVGDVMTREVACARPETSVEEARTVMKNHRIRHLPVTTSSGHLLGVVSIGDLNAHHADTQETTIHYLNEYLLGRC